MNKTSWQSLRLTAIGLLLCLGTGCETQVTQKPSGVEPAVASTPPEKAVESHAVHWTYGGEVNPTRWGEISPEYVLCETGTAQSPVNIENISEEGAGKIEFNYQPSPLDVVNNTHTIQVNYQPGSSIAIDGEQYELVQYHFHTPSEHQINKNAYAMELHLVHKNQQNQLAVVGVMIEAGNTNPVLEKIWEAMPKTEGENKLDAVEINVKDLLPANASYYSYTGSLTTPPCSEGIKWNVLTTPIQASEEQIAEFMEVYDVNARPIQPVGNRKIVLKK